jgi:hypothetical protein
MSSRPREREQESEGSVGRGKEGRKGEKGEATGGAEAVEAAVGVETAAAIIVRKSCQERKSRSQRRPISTANAATADTKGEDLRAKAAPAEGGDLPRKQQQPKTKNCNESRSREILSMQW